MEDDGKSYKIINGANACTKTLIFRLFLSEKVDKIEDGKCWFPHFYHNHHFHYTTKQFQQIFLSSEMGFGHHRFAPYGQGKSRKCTKL